MWYRCAIVVAFWAALGVLSGQAQAQNPFFQPPLFGGSGPTVTGDFNGDGKADLISADGSVLLGNGDGTFTAAASLGGSGNLIATADFNHDGKLDVVLASTTSPGFSIFLSNGDGTFQVANTTTTIAAVLGIAVADVNKDGNPDVIVLLSSGSAMVFKGQGNGTFVTDGVAYTNGGILITTADVNGDGKVDLVLVTAGGIQVLPGNPRVNRT
jgi:hypothetical protein